MKKRSFKALVLASTLLTAYTPPYIPRAHADTFDAVPSASGAYARTNRYPGNNFFGGGSPWSDIQAPTPSGCGLATSTGVIDDTVAVQCHINYMSATYNGGIVRLPCGTFLLSNQGANTALSVPANIWLEGQGLCTTIITNTDTTLVNFNTNASLQTCPSGNHNGGMEKVNVVGYTGASPVRAAIVVGGLCNVTLRDNKILYGSAGLRNDGVDTLVENCFIWGFTYALLSTGANWYIRDKFDQPAGTAATYGYFQSSTVAGLTLAENHFILCDFFGGYTDAIHIDDATSTSAITTFTGTVFGAPIHIVNQLVTMIDGGEIGSTTLNIASGYLAISAAYAFNPTTVTGAGVRSCAANVKLTC